jgi:WD40 repeat protein
MTTGITKLMSHESTIVTIRFSDDNKWIATAGKDRALCIHQIQARNEDSSKLTPHNFSYTTVFIMKNAHKRIIWDSCWTSDSNVLITGSRDGVCKIWKLTHNLADNASSSSSSNTTYLSCMFKFSPFDGVSVQALDIHPQKNYNQISDTNNWLLAIGAESGSVVVFKLSVQSNIDENTSIPKSSDTELAECSNYINVVEICKSSQHFSHGSSVQRIRWKFDLLLNSNNYSFASCGDDFTLRIFSVDKAALI